MKKVAAMARNDPLVTGRYTQSAAETARGLSTYQYRSKKGQLLKTSCIQGRRHSQTGIS